MGNSTATAMATAFRPGLVTRDMNSFGVNAATTAEFATVPTMPAAMTARMRRTTGIRLLPSERAKCPAAAANRTRQDRDRLAHSPDVPPTYACVLSLEGGYMSHPA